jgi:hypothetical protein
MDGEPSARKDPLKHQHRAGQQQAGQQLGKAFGQPCLGAPSHSQEALARASAIALQKAGSFTKHSASALAKASV